MSSRISAKWCLLNCIFLKDPTYIAESNANEWQIWSSWLSHFIIKETVDADADKADVQHYAFFTQGPYSDVYLGTANKQTVCLQDPKGTKMSFSILKNP